MYVPFPTGTERIPSYRTCKVYPFLNYGLAQKYNGTFHLRFDDTNPTKEKTEFVESIKADIKWLGADWEITFLCI